MILVLAVLVLLAGVVPVEAVDRYATSTVRGAVATGACLTLPTACTVKYALSLSSAGDTVIMEGNTNLEAPYEYKGANDMIQPPTSRSGSSSPAPNGTPITVRCSVDGGCLINGEFVRRPVYLVDNNWWVFEGFNAKNGSSTATSCTTTVLAPTGGATIHVINSGHNIFRRIVAWDTCIIDNHVVWSLSNNAQAAGNAAAGFGSSNNLLEDVAGFGTGRKILQLGYAGANNNVCRRCWFRGEGSTSTSVTTASPWYLSTGHTFENVIATWSGESTPQTYTSSDGFNTARTGYIVGMGGVVSGDRLHVWSATPVPKPSNVKLLGTIVYVKKDDGVHNIYASAANASPQNPNGKSVLYRLFGVSNTTVTDAVAVMDPDHTGFNQHVAFTGHRRNHNCVCSPGPPPETSDACAVTSGGPCENPVANNVATRLTSIRGNFVFGADTGDSFSRIGFGAQGYADESDWKTGSGSSVTGLSAGNCMAGSSEAACTGAHTTAVQSPWQNTSSTGARVCFQIVNGVTTTTPLWPWPMNARIKAATKTAGPYAGPCRINCATGGVSWQTSPTVPNLTPRTARQETDVMADIQSLLGTIPFGPCRSDSPPTTFQDAVGFGPATLSAF